MPSNSTYVTEQKNMLLDCLMQNKERQLSAADIFNWFHDQGHKASYATIYRNLDKLEKEGTVRKFMDENGKQACWQYTIDGNGCHDHYHLKCCRCGKVIHLKCNLMDSLENHVMEEHLFQLDRTRTVLYGCCQECMNGAS